MEQFFLARIELTDGRIVFGIRYDRNIWNDRTEENGSPVVGGGRHS